MMGDRLHERRIRCYEFAYVVPWAALVDEDTDRDTGADVDREP